MKKRGQFYLIAAIILSAIIISVAATTNFATANQNSNQNQLNSLKEELQIESARTVDYAINNQQSNGQINTLLQNFTQNYINSQKDKNLYFVYGTQGSVTINLWQANAHTVILDGTTITNSLGQATQTITPSNTTVVLKIGTDAYSIGLKYGQNFYFVVSKESEGEKYVVTG